MKPQLLLRARGAALALGAAGLTCITVAAAPAASVPTPGGAPAAAEPATRTSAGFTRARSSVSVAARDLNVSAGRRAWVRGALRAQGGTVRLQRRTGSGRWTTIAHDRTDSGGRYRLRYRTRRPGSHVVRVRFSGDAGHRPAVRRVGRLNAFRLASASWYGPGLYGNPTACGGTLTASVLGVAHRSLPCGTRLTLRKGKRVVRVRVIDRGPFVAGRELDLSAAVKRRLGFGSTGTVGATM